MHNTKTGHMMSLFWLTTGRRTVVDTISLCSYVHVRDNNKYMGDKMSDVVFLRVLLIGKSNWV